MASEQLLDFDADAAFSADMLDFIDRNSWISPTSLLPVPPNHPVDTRVCERCISKKVKCDQQRPTCSRCVHGGHSCVYSALKRKPGPSRGSKRAEASRNSGSTAHTRTRSISAASALPTPSSQQSVAQSYLERVPGYPLDAEGERELVHAFFDSIHPSLQVFIKERVLCRYHANQLQPQLVRTICAITAKVLQPHPLWSGESLKVFLAHLLDGDPIDNEGATSTRLDTWHQACLLAFHAFHQKPGRQAWARIGRLTRQAYAYNLHRLDADMVPASQVHGFPPEELEEWRYVWWCIWSLDAYSNISTSNPVGVDFDNIDTALLSSPASPKLRLQPPATGGLCQTVAEVIANGGDVNRNMHIVTETLLVEAATVHRMICSRQPTDRLRQRLAGVHNNIVMVQLALPPRFSQPTRNILDDETPVAHCARLVCLFHLQAARIFVSLPIHPSQDASDKDSGWLQVLQSCEEIVSLVRQWDVRHSSTVDPAVCFIACAAFLLLNLHCKIYWHSGPSLTERFQSQTRILVLFLEHFANMWKLPRVLLDLITAFSSEQAVPALPTQYAVVDQLIGRTTISLSSDPPRSDGSGVLPETWEMTESEAEEINRLMNETFGGITDQFGMGAMPDM